MQQSLLGGSWATLCLSSAWRKYLMWLLVLLPAHPPTPGGHPPPGCPLAEVP